MYISIYNSAHTTTLSLMSGKLSEAEWQTIYDNLVRQTEDAIRTRQDFIFVSIAHPDAERPNATWRRKLAELRNKSEQPLRGYSVIVTSSLLLRGVITTINWIVPAKPGGKITVVETFEEALAWLQKETNKPLDYLIEMHRSCLAQLPKSSSAQ